MFYMRNLYCYLQDLGSIPRPESDMTRLFIHIFFNFQSIFKSGMLSTPKIKLLQSIPTFRLLQMCHNITLRIIRGTSCENVSLVQVSNLSIDAKRKRNKRAYLFINHHVVTIKRLTTFYRFICRFYLRNTCLYKSVKFYVSDVFHASKELHYFKHTDQLWFLGA